MDASTAFNHVSEEKDCLAPTEETFDSTTFSSPLASLSTVTKHEKEDSDVQTPQFD